NEVFARRGFCGLWFGIICGSRSSGCIDFFSLRCFLFFFGGFRGFRLFWLRGSFGGLKVFKGAVFGLAIVAQAEKDGSAEMLVVGPVSVLDAGDEFRPYPGDIFTQLGK